MSVPKSLVIGSLSLFAVIAILAFFKKNETKKEQIVLSEVIEQPLSTVEEDTSPLLKNVEDPLVLQEVDQVWRLFTTSKKQFPIVKTMKYKSRVPWLKDRPAWIGDYASHYETSRHFIARSLNQKVDYVAQSVSTGDLFNVFRDDITIRFHLVVDLSRCKMWFYYVNGNTNERVLIKTYHIGLGRFNDHSTSGILTPKGTYRLGEKVAIYKPGVQGVFQNQEVEMVQVFGTRWIPFAEEITGQGDSARGYGFHGAPWVYDQETDSYQEIKETIGKYESDGCIRLSQADMEELFAIVISKPTIVDIVDDFMTANLPGHEVQDRGLKNER